MVDFRPFRALRPPEGRADQVAAVPYDVVNTAEARALVEGNPDSLLRVTRPDVDLPDGADLHGPQAYAAATAAFADLKARGALALDEAPGFFVYAQTMGDHRQVGIVGAASAADYAAGRIKKHEHTRPEKEDDRARHIEAVRAHLGPVFLAFRDVPAISDWVARASAGAPEVDFVAEDGVRHQLWPVFDPKATMELRMLFSTRVEALYIADGHHRTAAAARVGAGADPESPRARFLAVAFPDTALRILPYNRVVLDLHGHTPGDLMDALEDSWIVERLDAAEAPTRPLQISMRLAKRWWRLTLRPKLHPDASDPVARLDVSVVQDRLLGPLLGVADPRTSTRIEFVGGIRGLAALEAGADACGGVAFALYPTSLADLMAISDAGEVMPPKSTWFEPKLRSGLVISEF